MTNELKPCPFCGNKPRIEEFRQLSFPWQIICDCHKISDTQSHTCFIEADTKEEAIEAWNTRYELTCKPIDKYCCGVPLCGNCGVDLNMIVSGVRPFNKILPNFCHMCGSKVVGD